MTQSDIQNELNAITILLSNPHINIVKVLAHGIEDTRFYINMEYCEFNLGEYIANEEKTRSSGLKIWPLATKEARAQYLASHVMYDLISGIEFLHACGLVHRDLSLDNGKHYIVLAEISAILGRSSSLEDRRFRHHFRSQFNRIGQHYGPKGEKRLSTAGDVAAGSIQ